LIIFTLIFLVKVKWWRSHTTQHRIRKSKAPLNRQTRKKRQPFPELSR